MTIFGMCHIKSINIFDGIRNFLAADANNAKDINFKQFTRRQSFLFQKSIEEVFARCYMVVKINNRCDVCVQLKRKPHLRKTVTTSFENEFDPNANVSLDQVVIQYMLGMQL
jgi:hypothetical protein